ncbi:MAG: TraB/GumN family protein [Brevundimonas sp.]|nr:MAG: TraB/GumN family protein [Brevundimonas sp.]
MNGLSLPVWARHSARLKSTVAALGLIAAVAFQPAPALAQANPATPARAAAVAPVLAPDGGPGLWVIRDADSTLYLYGTVHVLRPQTVWRWGDVERAFDSADQIWFEISNPDDQAAMAPLIQQYGVSADRPLNTLLTPAENAELTEAANAINVPPARMNVFRPWLAGLTLSMAPLVKAGYDPQSGVELSLKARAEAAGKPIHGFETIDEQVRILANLPEAEQLQFLRSVLDGYEDATTELDGMVTSWSEGDMRAVERLGVTEMRRESPAIYRAMLTDRNTNWAGQIQTLLNGEGTAFIAVGAAHLVGPDSVQNILARRGVRAVRIH